MEAGASELGGGVLEFEVDGDEVGGGRQMERGGGEEALFPGLGGGVIELEDAEGRMWIAQGKGIEAGAEQDVLADAPGDRGGKGVFGKSGAGDEKGAEGVGVGPVEADGRSLEFLGVGGTEDWKREWVWKDEGIGVDELVCGTPESYAEGGAGWGGGTHAGCWRW